MGHWTYTVILIATLAAAAWLQALPGVHVLNRPRRLGLALLPGLLFVAWDILAAEAHWWAFSARYTFGARLFGLPLEELAFFLVVPVCAVLGYEAVRVTLPRVGRQ
ncbi:lycopene cyclase domain-containing protein [Antricoccus suffuscus]|uniref:Lycopene cyclase domain-containing protein n=1 Tax=Antricoccus suffuscus TaxID=1629062 RepID=A0A2T0ZYR3_9ACTN|nr:lycopene cyclase domain-containing protein [Antricoccus suffuscus]PRZ41387.1 lycopene cyclase domain-containing protein [Antricoccus suffuscus]